MKRPVGAGLRNPALVWALALVLLLALALVGCAPEPDEEPESEPEPENAQEEPEAADDEPATATVTVDLYFSDAEAEFLEAEERELEGATDEELARAVVEALIEGSETGLGNTLPQGTQVLDVQVEDGLAIVDLSSEFRDEHWGGTAGEQMTIYSVVNSLAGLDGVDSVQILLEGQEEEAVLGHLATGEPLEPDWELVE